MKKRMLLAGIFFTMILALAGAKEKKQLSDAGKNGAITVKIGKHMTVISIDDQDVKLKGKIKLDPGIHKIKIKYAHYTENAAITGSGYKEFNFKEGCGYSMIGYEHLYGRSGGALNIVIRDSTLPKITGSEYFTKEPEIPAQTEVKIMHEWPEEGTYETACEVSFRLGSIAWVRKSLTDDIKMMFFKKFLSENGIDYVVEFEQSYNEFSGYDEYSGIGLKKIEK